jgi:hypothetical protein
LKCNSIACRGESRFSTPLFSQKRIPHALIATLTLAELELQRHSPPDVCLKPYICDWKYCAAW